MSITVPPVKQIRLPFSVPRPNKAGAQPVRICGICRKRDSRYTCPRCNIAYCGLDCFKDEKHAQCSEPFYRTTVLDSIAADPKASVDEKKGMVEMLKRFEEGAGEDEGWLEQLREDEQEDELISAFEGVDLDNIDSNALFHLLPQAHRDKFLAALRDPGSVEAQQLLSDAAIAGEGDVVAEDGDRLPDVLPWWEDDHLSSYAADMSNVDGMRWAEEPDMLDETILIGIDPSRETAVKLVYNAVAICLAYLHALLPFRLPSLSEGNLKSQEVSPDEVKQELGRLVPFLVEPKSTVRYESAREAWTAVWESIGETNVSRDIRNDGAPPAAETEMAAPPTALLVRLLSLVPRLLHPPLDMTQPVKCLRLLSDLHAMHSRIKTGGLVPRKLAFYIAALQKLERKDWLRLESEVVREVAKLQEEVGAGDEESPRTEHLLLE